MDVFLLCCVFSGRGLCYELINRPEESYRLWRVAVCDHDTSWYGEAIAHARLQSQRNKQTNKAWLYFSSWQLWCAAVKQDDVQSLTKEKQLSCTVWVESLNIRDDGRGKIYRSYQKHES
jgi:hypothetical protein